MRVMRMFGAALGLIVAVATVSPVHAQGKGIWDKISESGTLTCGAMAAVPMGSWKVEGPNRYEGYAIGFCRELTKELTKAMGKPIKLDFYETTFANVVLDLQSGKADLFAGMSATEERKKALDMTGPMYDLAHCVVQKKGLTGLKTWADYSKPEIKISSATGTSDEKALQEMAPKATNMSFKENAQAILAVQSGRADGYVTNILNCLRIQKESPEVFGEFVVPTPVRGVPSAGGMRKDGDGRFFKFVDEWAARSRANGTVKAIISDAIAKNGLDPNKLPAEFSF